MYFSTRRMRRSPFMDVRFISPDSTAGRMTCAAWPIWVWMMSTLTEKRPPASIAATMASTSSSRVLPAAASIASFTMFVRLL